MLTLIVVLKGLLEVVLLVYLAQAILFLIAGSARNQNVIFQTLKIVTAPLERFIQLITPSMVLDRHIPFVVFSLGAFGWIILTITKIKLVLMGVK